MKAAKVLTAIVAVSMIGAAAAGCSGSKKDKGIEGKYTAEWDFTDSFIEGMGVDIDTDAEIILEMELELEDGEYTIVGDRDALMDSLEAFIMDRDFKSQMLDQMGLGIYSDEELDSIAQYHGYSTFDEYWTESFFESISDDQLDMNGRGTYEIDGDTVILTSDRDGHTIEGEYDDGTLVLYDEEIGERLEFTK